ncbi:cytochrome P450 [Massilia sp. Root133]|uniref:cytochrome P450 n=1 Tax=unclassified Massilia TaxID=2609279 RepID=UPI0007017E9E|nr:MULTISPECIES: cytochrome P450 [unclassified Massilia]KQY16146.1 cytochrome P450 [Massilia sp. Root133]KQZ45388.1 cytochrome P450 [Massilia sp. Root1485]
MKTTTPPSCPFHAGAASSAPASHPPGTWPPGPPSGLTGWRFLRAMSRDLLGALSAWRDEYGGMVHLRIWPEHQIVVTDPERVRELLVDHHDALVRWERAIEVFAQVHGHSTLTTEGAAWRTKRHALQPAFTPRAVQAFLPAMAHAADAAFAQWPRSDAAWAIESAFTSLGMDVIVRMMFSSGIVADARDAERAVHDVAVAGNAEMYWPRSWPDWMPWKARKRRALATLDRLIDGHVQARMALPQADWPQDLLTRLLALHVGDPVTWPLKAVRDECMSTFLAGHETTAAALTWWSWCMAANPSVQAAARAEVDAVLQGRLPAAADLPALDYLGRTLQETLRLYPAAPILITRRSVRPITLGGWQLPARTMFGIPLHLMHHDARWFPEPDAFRPERFAPGAPAIPRGAFMPFGTGPRVCLGQHLALAEMTLLAAMFLQRYMVEAPAGMAPPKPVFNITLRPETPLTLRITART